MVETMKKIAFLKTLCFMSILALAPLHADAENTKNDKKCHSTSRTSIQDFAGGGVFISEFNIVNNARATLREPILNSVVALGIQGVDINKINVEQAVTGEILLSTTTQQSFTHRFTSDGTPCDEGENLCEGVNDCSPIFRPSTSSTVFLSQILPQSVLLLSFNRCNGDYDMIIRGVKLPSSTIYFDHRATSDGGLFSGQANVQGDSLIGRLTRVNGVVYRSDWTTGFENYVGFGQPSLTINGVSIQTCGNTCATCARFAAAVLAPQFATLPSAQSFAPGGENFGKLPYDRILGGNIEVVEKPDLRGCN